jgi:hypothetical protein
MQSPQFRREERDIGWVMNEQSTFSKIKKVEVRTLLSRFSETAMPILLHQPGYLASAAAVRSCATLYRSFEFICSRASSVLLSRTFVLANLFHKSVGPQALP